MSTMTDETYNGYANRETWAFNLHWQNDQGLYNYILDDARDFLAEPKYFPDREISDRQLGERAVAAFRDLLEQLDEGQRDLSPYAIATDIGSFWRINEEEVGAAVRESLEVES